MDSLTTRNPGASLISLNTGVEWIQRVHDPNSGNWRFHQGSEAMTIQKLLDEPGPQSSGINIFFLPRVKEFEKAPDLRRKLSNNFKIPSFFWTETAYEANGFFGSRDDPIEDYEGKSHCSFSRFLIKEILPAGGYDWQYLAFHSLWFAPKAPGVPATQILFCFDISSKMKKFIVDGFQASAADSIKGCPFAVYDTLMETVITYYDKALWAFRKPIRDIEKQRQSNRNPGAGGRNALDGHYLGMHELSRHVIHASETLRVASKTLESMIRDHDSCCEQIVGPLHPNGSQEGLMQSKTTQHTRQTARALHFYASFLANLQLRAQSFDERLKNEIRLAYNLVAAENSNTAKEILRESATDSTNSTKILEATRKLLLETRNDGRELTNIVSLLTLMFLPGAFISGFFGMNFFEFTPGNGTDVARWAVSHEIWLFFVTAVPITVTGLVIWIAIRLGHWKPPKMWRRRQISRSLSGLSI